MRKLALISTLTLTGLLSGCGPSYEYDGLYQDGNYVSAEHSVSFCTVRKGGESISWIVDQARKNTAIETSLSEVKQIDLESLKSFVLKHSLEGDLRLTLGTSIGDWKKLGYKPFEYPCLSDDNVLNFTQHVKSPYGKKTKEDITELTMSNENFEKFRNI
tara:strand:+ start:738 stop:1214 length:477 start_codon:yes stop_codon:yes gene_type:complete